MVARETTPHLRTPLALADTQPASTTPDRNGSLAR